MEQKEEQIMTRTSCGVLLCWMLIRKSTYARHRPTRPSSTSGERIRLTSAEPWLDRNNQNGIQRPTATTKAASPLSFIRLSFLSLPLSLSSTPVTLNHGGTDRRVWRWQAQPLGIKNPSATAPTARGLSVRSQRWQRGFGRCWWSQLFRWSRHDRV